MIYNTFTSNDSLADDVMVTDVYVSSTCPDGGSTETHLTAADDQMSINRRRMLLTDVYESTDIITDDEISADEKVLLFSFFSFSSGFCHRLF